MSRLFSDDPIDQVLEQIKIEFKRKIESENADYLLTVSESDYTSYLIKTYTLLPPMVDQSRITIDFDEMLKQDNENLTEENTTIFSGKLEVTVMVPFQGSICLFYCKPSDAFDSPPEGRFDDHRKMLTIKYEVADRDPEKFKASLDRDLTKITQFVESITKDVIAYNSWIKEKANVFLTERKNQILRNLGFVRALGISFQEDNTLPKTYPISLEIKTINIQPPTPSSVAFEPEPTLNQDNYEKILEVISLMTLAMERSPLTFVKLKEPEIRDFFLIVLNSHFKIQATSETFNNLGKTDILLRVNEKNAFIAECKFWRGRKSFLGTIDQILSYLSWRDTKACILLFYKGNNFSQKFEKIIGMTTQHQNYKRPFALKNNRLSKETIASFVFNNPNDRNRELILTILAFPILIKNLQNQ